MWHPNSEHIDCCRQGLIIIVSTVYEDGTVCISILVGPHFILYHNTLSITSPRTQHAPGDDQYGYEDAGERWMPVHTVESIVSLILSFRILTDYYLQLLSVISLLSSDTPNLDSPANVDAAKEVRADLAGQLYPKSFVGRPTYEIQLTRRKFGD